MATFTVQLTMNTGVKIIFPQTFISEDDAFDHMNDLLRTYGIIKREIVSIRVVERKNA